MPDYSSNYTHRAKVLIHSTLGEKNLLMRFVEGANILDALQVVVGFANLLKPLFYSQVSWDQFYWCPAGETDFIYIDDVGVNSPLTASPMEDADKDIRWSFVGQSTKAGRAIIYQNAIALPRPSNNRLSASANATLAEIINYLNDNTIICASDGEVVKWYPYANWKANDRDVRSERRTGV